MRSWRSSERNRSILRVPGRSIREAFFALRRAAPGDHLLKRRISPLPANKAMLGDWLVVTRSSR